MIVKFKLFESSDGRDELIKQLGNDFIDEYFRKEYSAEVEEIIDYVDFWRFVDDDHFVKDWIYDYVQNTSMDEFTGGEYKDYIKSELLKYVKVENFLDKKAKKLGLEDNSYEDIVDNLEEEDLKKIIVKLANKEEEFYYYVYENRYSNFDARDILEEIYGEADLHGKKGYKMIENYVNDNDIIEAFYDEADEDFKRDFIDISSNKKIQLKLLKMKSENAIALFNEMQVNYSIGDTYKFQNTYMKEIMKDLDLEEDELFIAKKLKALSDKFGLASGIEKKYDKYAFYLDIEKYNL